MNYVELKLEADDVSFRLLELFRDAVAVGPVAALDGPTELPLLD